MNRPAHATWPRSRSLALVAGCCVGAVFFTGSERSPAQAPPPTPQPLPLLTNAAQILQLGRDGVPHLRHNVDFEAVITLRSPQGSALWVQDGTAAVYVYHTNRFNRQEKQRVRVRGVTGTGRIAPWVENGRVEVIGAGEFPAPVRVPVFDLSNLDYFGRWVEVEGVFRAASNEAGVVKATLVSATFPVSLRLPPVPAPVLQDWVERSARVRGVCWTEVDAKRNSAGFVLHVPTTNEVEWLKAPAPGRGTMPNYPLGAGLALLPRIFDSPRSPANVSNTLPVLTNIQQVLALGLDGASARPHPVNLVGVVTYPGGQGTIYIEDGTGGIQVIYTYTDNLPNRFAGQVVWVDGIAGAGPIKPWIAEAKLKVINTMTVPPPRRPPPAEIAAGQWHGYWVEVEGVVRDIVRGGSFGVLVTSDGKRFEADVPHRGPRIGTLPMEWYDARVTVRGVAVSDVDTRGRPTATRILLNDAKALTIVREGKTNLFDRDFAKVSKFRERSAGSDELVKVAGTVLYQAENGRIFLRGEDGPFQAAQLNPLPRRGSRMSTIPRPQREPLRAGDRVELVGAPAVSPLAPLFLDAEYLKVSSGTAPAALEVSPSEVASGRRDADLVAVRARVVGRETRTVDGVDYEAFQLQDGENVFEALCSQRGTNAMPDTPRNSVVRATGICSVSVGAGQNHTFRILMRDPQDLQVLGTAAPWELVQPGRVLAISGGLGALALTWIGLLRRQVSQRRQAEEKARRNEAVTRTINYFATSLLERHDEDEILWDLARNCVSQLGFEDCVIYLLDAQKNVLVQRAAFGPKNPEGTMILNPITIQVGQGIVGTVAKSGRPEIITDTQQDRRYIVDDAHRLSEIAVPIVANGQVLGVIDSEHEKAGFFTADHLDILKAIASLCANKLVRVRVEQQLRGVNMELEKRVTERTTDLRASEARKAAVLETALDSIITIDQQGCIIDFNPAAEKTFGYTRVEALGREMAELIIPPELRERHREGLKRAVETGADTLIGKRIEISALRRNGEQFLVELALARIRTESGSIFTAHIQDISDRKRAEKLQRAIYEISAVVHAAEDLKSFYARIHEVVRGVMPADNFFLLLHNPTTDLHEYAYHVDQMDPWPEPRKVITGLVGHILKTGRPLLADRTSMTNPDHAWCFVSGTPSAIWLGAPLRVRGETIGVMAVQDYHDANAYSAKEEKILAYIADQTALAIERKRTDAALADSERRLRQSLVETERSLAQEKELSELKSRFVSMVSHEFRTPLGIITSSAEILDAYLDRLSIEDRRSNLRDITDATRHMARMMEEVLLLGRVEAGKMTCRPAPLDLAVFGQRLVDEVTSATNSRCQFQFAAASDLIEAQADESLLRHIFTNLLNNAAKYSAAGSMVEFHVEARDHLAIFHVRDRGIGIPEADARLIFQAFHRGRNVGDTPGTGLGMTVVKRCVELHGGKIAFESKEGHGTTFVVALPLFGPVGVNGEGTTQFFRSAIKNTNLTFIP